VSNGILVRADALSGEHNSPFAARTEVIDLAGDLVSVGDEVDMQTTVNARLAIRVIAAYLSAVTSLAFLPLRSIVARVRSTRELASRGATIPSQWDVEEWVSAVSVFRQVRPYLFTAEGQCLLHALTLVKFLHSCGLYPRWVIGVATRPWGAHSWVQWNQYLLDTNPEKVCRYTPILVV
jgi:hypothetical protein